MLDFGDCMKTGIFIVANFDSLNFLGFLMASALYFGYITVKFLPLGEAMTICMSGPIFTAILARIFLKHRLMAWKLFFSIVLFCGLILVVQPEALFSEEITTPDKSNIENNTTTSYAPVERDSSYYVGAIVGLASAVCFGASAVVLSGTMDNASTYVLILYSASASVVIALISAPINPLQTLLSYRIMNIPRDRWILYSFVTIGAILSNLCTIKSFQMTDPTTVVVLHQFEVVMGFLIQVFLMNELSNWLSFLGSALVVFGVIMITIEKEMVAKMPECLQKWL